ncbi:MAG TPA: BlaI/MecI/CopY family transcriptional regulator [Sphingomonadaceae bacterium]
MAETDSNKPERISEAEHAVMEALWAKSPLSATDVAERIGEARGWSLPTIKTLLSRLVAKNVVATEPQGRRFLYRPLLARDDYVSGESRRLVERLFGGRAAPLFARLAEAEALSDEDIAEIETLLRELKQ